jgi:hypothetical protein
MDPAVRHGLLPRNRRREGLPRIFPIKIAREHVDEMAASRETTREFFDMPLDAPGARRKSSSNLGHLHPETPPRAVRSSERRAPLTKTGA